MSKVSVFNHAWIDLVFEGRNQSYGAYQLRRQDPQTTMLALFTGIGIMVALVSIPAAINYFKGTPTIDQAAPPTIIQVDNLDNTIFNKKEEPKPEPETQSAAPAAPKNVAKTTAFTPLVATPDPVVATPKTTDFVDSDPGKTTDPGDGTKGFNTGVTSPDGKPDGTGTNTKPDTGNGLETSASVDVMPMYPGGMARFYKEVGNKFRTPEVADATTLKVYVSFVIEKDGTMTNIKVGRDPGHGIAAEALRVLQSIKTKWEAGKIKGVPVRTAYTLPITVNVN